MRTVLIIAYYFPPLASAGTQRFAKFVKWLPSFGWRPVVVTTAAAMTKHAYARDESLGDDIPADVAVHRTPSDAAAPLGLWRRLRLKAKFRVDNEEWSELAWPTALQAARDARADAVVVTCSPFAAAELGARLGRELGVRWLLDLRDPWAMDGWKVFPTRLHQSYELSVMRRALRSANVVVANTPQSRLGYIEMAGLDPRRVCTISNGFDADDFRGIDALPPSDRFVLAHVGTLHGVQPPRRSRLRTWLSARWEPLDETARSGRYLYEALGILKRSHPDLFAMLRVRLAGSVHASHRELAGRLGIGGVIEERGYVSHHEALQTLAGAHAVFLPLFALPPGQRSLIVPGKTYEVLASERFVLGALPDGDAADLIRLTDAGAVCRADAPDDIAARLAEAIGAWRDGRPIPAARRGQLAPFLRERLTARLAAALDFAVGAADALPQDDPWVEAAHLDRGARQAALPAAAAAAR